MAHIAHCANPEYVCVVRRLCQHFVMPFATLGQSVKFMRRLSLPSEHESEREKDVSQIVSNVSEMVSHLLLFVCRLSRIESHDVVSSPVYQAADVSALDCRAKHLWKKCANFGWAHTLFDIVTSPVGHMTLCVHTRSQSISFIYR